ncbi:MAG: hypothetical protein Q8L74_14095 [Nitrospirota bacterium]|nr:hypothetical protein [Nitrospirota bacterium]MDP2383080.1 hypothetical protein [Nitrospirota bacterium]MDP3598345.1 hypothetical protein [Nitrospirota bacterium]
MKDGNRFWQAVRISWPVLGGMWGAWVGFGGYHGVTPNADSFAMVFVLGFYSLFALGGLVAGMTSAALTGGLVEWLLRRYGVGLAGAVIVATVVSALVVWQLSVVVQAKYPGLRPPAAKPAVSSPIRSSPANPCARMPPENSKERRSWDAECR